MTNLLELSQEELTQGWHADGLTSCCNYCDYHTTEASEQAVELMTAHIESVHQSNLAALLAQKNKYNTLTEKQKTLLLAFATGEKDQVIAKQTGTAHSTIRHQKFTFREKAKQARFYLATYENAFNLTTQKDRLLPVPTLAGNIDDRFAISEDEYHKALTRYFDFSAETPRITKWPKQQKMIIALLHRVVEEITPAKQYSEREITELLRQIYLDPVMLRRYLIEYGFVSRKNDGSSYWREQ